MPAPADAQKIEPSDADLLRRVAAADVQAYEHVFRRYWKRIRAFMLRAGAAEADADEIAQDVMVAVWRRAGSFDPERAAATTWIYAIARNRRIDLIRQARRPAPDPEDPSLLPDPAPSPVARVTASEREARVRQGLARLAPLQRDALRMAFFDGMSHAEIAAATGVPLGTVKSRIRLGVRHLRDSLGEDLAEGG